VGTMEYTQVSRNGLRKVRANLPNLRNISQVRVRTVLEELSGHEDRSIKNFEAFQKEYAKHTAEGHDAVILVGFGQVMMHYAVALITQRGIPSRNIFIIDRAENVGGCLYMANTFGWFGAPSNPLVFYPFELYGTCYHKMKFDPLGISSPNALTNMHIILDHFGFRVYMGTAWEAVEPLLHPRHHCIKPAYRDVLKGRMAGAMNGVDAVDLAASNFHLVGMGSTVGDVVVELVKRRCETHGHQFTISLHYRTPRRFTTYMGTLVQPPGCFPFYSSGPYSSLGVDIDVQVLKASEQKYPELERMLGEFVVWDKARQMKNETAPFSAIMNVLTHHPSVALKMKFLKIRDKSDVDTRGEPSIDCTNAINYHNLSNSDLPSNRVDLAPNMLTGFPSLRQMLWGGARPSGPMHGQWSTALGCTGHTRHPQNKLDHSSPVGSCALQCYSVLYFAQYHSVASWFTMFQYSPTSVQLLSAWTYEFVMRFLAVTGFTSLFFDHWEFNRVPHQSPSNNFQVIEERWKWFSDVTFYRGPNSTFPCPFEQLPGVPRCFDWSWIAASKTALYVRMLITTLLVAGCMYAFLSCEMRLEIPEGLFTVSFMRQA